MSPVYILWIGYQLPAWCCSFSRIQQVMKISIRNTIRCQLLLQYNIEWFSFYTGFGPLVWVTTSEIYPSHLKALGCGLSASFCWFLSFFLTLFFASFTETYGKATAFWGFGVFCIFAFLFVTFQLPDTHRKSFQEIQEMIHGKNTSIDKIENTKEPKKTEIVD